VLKRRQLLLAALASAAAPVQALDGSGPCGSLSLLWRAGQLVSLRTEGSADLAGQHPLRADAIVRIYSMTKAVASAAAQCLADDGKLALDEPLADVLPGMPRGVRIRHLHTHSAGWPAEGAAVAALHLDEAMSLADYAARVARLPLQAEPGKHFAYDGLNTELLARAVEQRARQPFERFVHERLIAPLGMADTAWQVPAEKLPRVVDLVQVDAAGRRSATAPDGAPLKRYASAAGGLYSTAGDYLRFCRMLLAGGELEGRRVLSRERCAEMLHNQLEAGVTSYPGQGFGLGGAVQLDPARSTWPGPAGQYGWLGAAGTWFRIDPSREQIALFFAQVLPGKAAGTLARDFFASVRT
jgi:CubicO group peptidase (beta-lactamase class C family)